MSIFTRFILWLLAPFIRKPRQLIDGPQITLGNKIYTIAPLNFATLKQVTPLLESFKNLGKTPSIEDYDNMVKFVWLALKRNHPNIKLKEVERGLDLYNIMSIQNMTMSAGGAVPRGEAKTANQ